MCGEPSRYCPGNNPHPLIVPDGYYSIGGNDSTRSVIQIAPAGYYAVLGLLYPCPAGYFGAVEGLYARSCSGLCRIPGFYCPTASISPVMKYCGGDDFFCPATTVAPIRVHEGFYTVDYVYDVCPPGQWRNFTQPYNDLFKLDPGDSASMISTHFPFPVCQLCPDGTFKSVEGDDFSLCRPCNLRHSISADDRITCTCTAVLAPGLVSYFNITTGNCSTEKVEDFLQFNAGMWATNISLTRYQQFPCDPGHYCVDGLRFKCPHGYFGSLVQETRPLCEGLCANGYFCLVSSTSPYSYPCGAANLICPEGSFTPTLVPAGYYSNEDVREDRRYLQFICPTGYYCPGDGRRYQCPPGTYTSMNGTIDEQCMGPCDRGYYCTVGSSSPTQHRCGNASVYCPRGSSEPTPVHDGFYCFFTGADAGEQAVWDPMNTTCSVEIPCEPGYYCIKGVKYPCPPGTFGWRYGMNSSTCGGQCAPGYYCPSYLLPQPDAPPYTAWPLKPQLSATRK